MKHYSLPQLEKAGYDLVAPFEVELGDKRVLVIEAVLRILPGKRVVAKTAASTGSTLVKLFFHSRNFDKENKGYQRLHGSKIQTPVLLSAEVLPEGGGICHYEFIDRAQSFSTRWQAADAKTKVDLLAMLLAIVQQYYKNDLCQTDLHLDNFIFAGDKLYALDPASCEKLNADTVINNLALLLAQFQINEWAMIAAAMAETFPGINKAALIAAATAQQKIRRDNFLKKIYRESTYTQVWKIGKPFGQHFAITCVREQCSAEMRNLLENIDTIPESAEHLKRGESSVVLLLSVDGKQWVVKNSRNKNIWRQLRRCFGRSRASNAWHYSHMFVETGINTPTPIALIERKLGPLVLESWFVSEYIKGDNLLDIWLYQKPTATEIDGVKNIFNTMAALKISHGDMKATNLLVAEEKMYLIDFDGMKHFRLSCLAKAALQKDKKRFMENWRSTETTNLLKEL